MKVIAWAFHKSKLCRPEFLFGRRTNGRLDIDGIDMTVYWFPNTSDEFLLPLRRLARRTS